MTAPSTVRVWDLMPEAVAQRLVEEAATASAFKMLERAPGVVLRKPRGFAACSGWPDGRR